MKLVSSNEARASRKNSPFILLKDFKFIIDFILFLICLLVAFVAKASATPADTEPPTIENLSPANLSAHIDLNVGTLTMTLNENVFVGSLAESYDHFQLRILYGSSTPIQTFEVDDPTQVTVSGTTVTLHNVQTLSYGESYFIYTPRSGIVVDAAGNELAAMTNNGIWRFTTRKSDLVKVSSFPANGAQYVEPDATTDFTITFNEPPQSSPTTKYAYLSEIGGSSVQSWTLTSTNDVTYSGNTVTLKRSIHSLDPGKDYYIYTSADAFRDSQGRYFEGVGNSETDYWYFSTKTETTPPEINSISPAHGEEGVDPSLTAYRIQFNETTSIVNSGTVGLYLDFKGTPTLVDQASVSEITYSKGTYTIPFDGHGGLTAGGQYYVVIGSNIFYDSQQNYFGGTDENSWSFRANRVPTSISLSNSSVLEEEPASTVVGTISGVDPDNGDALSFSLVSGSGSTDNSSFTIVGGTQLQTTEVLDYEAGATRSIRIRATDNVGGTRDQVFTINITDIDDTAPQIVSRYPDESTVVDDRYLEYIEVTFDEPIAYTTDGFDRNVRLIRDGNVQDSWYDAGEGAGPTGSIIDGNTLRFPLDPIYGGGSQITMLLASSYVFESFVITDLSGNQSSILSIDFTTRDHFTGNDILTFDADGLSGVNINTDNHTITGTMSGNSTLSVTPTVTMSEGATCATLTNGQPITFESGVSQDFTVKAENNVDQIWTVTLTWPGMSGEFSIGTTGDFASLEAAFAEMETRGLAGDVTFALQDGYQDSKFGFFYIDRYTGSDTYTTTVTVEDGATSASISNYLMYLEGTQNLIFDGKGILHIDPYAGNYNFILRDNASAEACQNITFKDLIADSEQGFVQISEADNVVIQGNDVTVVDGSTAVILGAGSVDVDILDNIITMQDGESLSSSIGLNVQNNTGNVNVINNVFNLEALTANVTLVGIHIGLYNNVQIDYNTITSNGTYTGTNVGDRGISTANSNGTNAEIKNNLFQYTGSAKYSGYYYYNVVAGTIDFSYNNFDIPFSHTQQYYLDAHVPASKLGDGQFDAVLALYPDNTNAEVIFTDAANDDFSLSGTSANDRDLRGVPVDGITTDILGNTRSSTAPSKGAYETPNNIADIMGLVFDAQVGDAVIDEVAGTVTAEAAVDTDLTAITPNFTLYPGAIHQGGTPGSTNFTNPVDFTIIAENDNTRTWTVTITEEDLPPVANSYSPALNATGVLVNERVSIGFNEPTDLGTGYVHLHDGSSIVESVDVTSMSASHSRATYNSVLSVEFSNLLPETTYSILIDEGVVTDDADQPFAGIADQGTWSFTTMDDESVPPIWTYEYPETGSVDVPAADVESDGIFFEFDEYIVQGTGNIEIRNSATDELIKSIDVQDELNEVSAEGIDLYGVGLLPSATQVYVLVCDGCITDVLGNPYGGNNPGDWTFTTAGPRITGLSPADDATGVGVNDNLVVTFNEDVQYSGESGYLRIYKSDNTIVETIYFNNAKATFSNNTLTVNPDATFEGSTSYYIQITSTGINGVSSGLDFNGVADNTSWTFTTLDNVAPTITAYDPAVDATKVSNNASIVLTISEDVQLTNYSNDDIRIRNLSNPGTIYKTIDPSSGDVVIDGNTITITPSGGILSGAEEVEVYLGWSTTPFEDLAGNDLNELFSNEYAFTVDNFAPYVQSTIPANDAVDVAINIGSLTLELSENVVAGVSGNLELMNASNEVVKTFTMGTADLSISGSTVTLNNVPLLDNNAGYWIRNNNAGVARIVDLAGNALTNWTVNTIWEFTTEEAPDLEDPVVSSFSTTGSVALDADLSVTYNEPVQANTGNYFLRDASGQLIESLAVDGPNVSISGSTVTLNPTNNLIYHTSYYIEAFANVVQDLSGNPAPAIGSSDWTFDAEGIISSLSPSDEATDVSPFANLELTFSKTVVLQTGGSFRMFRKSDDVQVGVNWSFNGATLDGNTVTYDIPNNLEPGVELYMVIIGGIEDEAGNPVDITGNDTWNFTPVIQDQTVTLDPIATKTFGDGPFTFTPATATSGQSIDYTSSNTDVATVSGNLVTIVGAGSTTIRATQAGNIYYNPAFDEEVFTVDKAAQTITFNALADKVYGDDVIALSASVSPSGNDVDFEILSGDAVTLNAATNELTIVGTGEVTIRATSAESDDYLAAPAVDRTFTVSKKALSAVADDKTKVYGEANPTLTFGYDGFAYGEDASVLDTEPSISTDATANSGVGFYDITLEGGLDNNYTINPTDAQMEVTKKQLITTADDKSREYGESNPGLSRSFDGFVNGENSSNLAGPMPSISTTADINSDAGEYDITLNGGSDPNYEYVLVDGTLTVTKATLDVYGVSLIKNYGDDNPSLEIDYDGFKNGETSAVLTTLPNVSTDAAKYSAAGSYPITVSGGEDENYEFNYINGTLQIGKVSLTATADDQARTFGDSNPEFTITYSGFVSGEDESDLDVLPLASSVATSSSDAGAYDITIDALEDTNYEISTVSGTLTINKADQNITVEDITDKVISADPFDVVASVDSGNPLTYSVSGPASNDGNTITLTGDIGTVTVTVEAAETTNYNAASEDVIFEVNDKLVQTITFTIDDQTYGGEVSLNATASSELTVSYEVISGPVVLENSILTFTGTGEASIKATQAGDDEYNEAEPVTATFNIGKATLSATADDQSFVFGGELPEFTITYDGFVNGEDHSDLTEAPAASSEATADSDAGSYGITLAGGLADNYEFVLTNGTLTITKATATITLSDLDHQEDGEAKMPTVVTDPEGLDVVLTYNGESEAPTAAGTYTVIATIDDNNYEGSAEATMEIGGVTAVSANALPEIKVYPNPTTDWIGLAGMNERSQIELIDLKGQIVKTKLLAPGEKIQVSDLEVGFYQIRFTSNNRTAAIKFLISR